MSDRDYMKLLLDQNLEAMKAFVGSAIHDVKDELKNLREENFELKRSLEFTQGELDGVKRKCDELSQKMNTVSLEDVCDRIRLLEDLSRSKNLRIVGLEEQNNGQENSEQTLDKVQKLVRDKLLLSDVKLSLAYRIGIFEPTRTRQILVTCEDEKDKKKCLRVCNRLKGTKIYVNEDVSNATLKIRQSKMSELKRKREEGYTAFFSGTKIVSYKRNVPTTNVSSSAGPSSAPPINIQPPRTNKNSAGNRSTRSSAAGRPKDN